MKLNVFPWTNRKQSLRTGKRLLKELKRLQQQRDLPLQRAKPQALAKAETPPTVAAKGKAQMEPISTKRKSVARKKTRAGGIHIEEPLASVLPPPVENVVHIDSERMRAFENRECIGERHVNVGNLRDISTAFGRLFDQVGLSQICKFPETIGYCIHLVRTFYLCANQLQEIEGGPMEFHTTVRNTKLKITPQLIGEVLGMKAQLDGTHYMKGQMMTSIVWRTVVDRICMPDTQSAENSVFSKELRPGYRFLNFIVCYNILPNMQTKVLRWDRMLFLYLLGHPSTTEGLNINIPYLIWSRMARYVEHPHPTERLSVSMIIMRIFKKFNVDTRSSSYMHSLGTINDSTIVKSLPRQPEDTPTLPKSTRPSTSPQAKSAPTAPTATTVQAPPAAASRPATFDASEDDASVTSLYQEQQRLSSEQEMISFEQEQISLDLQRITADQHDLKKKYSMLTKLVKKIFAKLGCSSSEGSDSN